jgi:hypothetical protein
MTHNVRPQNSDNFEQSHVPQFINVCTVDETIGCVQDMILDHKEAKTERENLKMHSSIRNDDKHPMMS